jgi:hypothetical protein
VACKRKIWHVAADAFIIPRYKIFGQSAEATGNKDGFKFSPDDTKILLAGSNSMAVMRHAEDTFLITEDPDFNSAGSGQNMPLLKDAYLKRLETALASPDPSGVLPRAIVLVPFSSIGNGISKRDDAEAIGEVVTRMIAGHAGLSIQVITNDFTMKDQVARALGRHAPGAPADK